MVLASKKVENHCSSFAKGAGQWALLKLRNYVNLATLKTLYYNLIHSYLEYCISSWGLASTSTLASLKILHKRAIRIMMFAKRQTPSSPLFYSLNILKIEDLVSLKLQNLYSN